MLALKSELVLFLTIFYVSECHRRIKGGEEVTVDRKYMVYLVKSPISNVGYDYWLCGGAIVTSEFVITSAACVNDVDYLYVIAGYKKYVTDSEIDKDKCTASMKKKVIYTCSPKGYELNYKQLDRWSYIDIALVKVESPYDFNDPAYELLCSYKPTTIPINYEEKYQEPGMDTIALGWGHTTSWRKPKDTNNYNQKMLRYAPSLLLNKTVCIERYKDHINMGNVIKSYMICTLGKGNIDDAGNFIQPRLTMNKGCTSQQEKLLGFEGISCEDDSSEESYYEYDTKRNNKESKETSNISLSDLNQTHARKSGICQNDHGGPLVTWAGAREILIGVASVFKVSEEYQCMGPYLFTSTRCTGLFLDCILSSDFPSRSYLCDRPASERGYYTIARTTSWKDHPAGPADNEFIERSGPKPVISESVYINSNDRVLESNATEEKILIQKNELKNQTNPENTTSLEDEGSPINESHQQETKYEPNKIPADNKFVERSGPKPVISEGIFINNNDRALESNATKEKILSLKKELKNQTNPENTTTLKEGGSPVNESHKQETKYEPNKIPADNEFVKRSGPKHVISEGIYIDSNDRALESNATKEKILILKIELKNQKNPENTTTLEDEGSPVNESHQQETKYEPNKMYVATTINPENKSGLEIKSNPVNNRSLDIKKILTNDGHLAQSWTNGKNPGNESLLKNTQKDSAKTTMQPVPPQ